MATRYYNPETKFEENHEKIIDLVKWRTYYLIRHAKTRRKKYKKKLEEIDKEIEFLKPKFEEFNVTLGEEQKVKFKVQCVTEGGIGTGKIEDVSVPGDFYLDIKKDGSAKIIKGKPKAKDSEYIEWLKRLGC